MLHYNQAAALTALRTAIIKALTILQKDLLAEAQSGMSTPEGANDLTLDNIKDVAGVISAAVLGGPWATIDEFGTGSLMDTSNPFLQAYRQSGLWNPARGDNTIRGRPAGTYQTMFGTMETSSGNAAGRDLERLARVGVIDQKYLPKPPSQAIRTATRWLEQGRFQRVIIAAIQSFPWGSFLIARP